MEGKSEGNMQPDVRVIVWSLPRTISTVLTKCVSFIDGMNVVLEPYGYAHAAWLGCRNFAQKDLPMTYEGNEAIFDEAAEMMGNFTKSKIDPQRIPFSNVLTELENLTGKYVFVKDQSHAMAPKFRQYLPKGYRHVFLIRDPSAIFVSYRKAMYKQAVEMDMLQNKSDKSDKSEEAYDLVEDDVIALEPLGWYKNHHDLWKYVKEHYDPNPIIVDSTDVLTNPAKHIKLLIESLDLPYSESLLQWPSSTEALKAWKTPGEGILDSHINFYGTAMRSTCFMPPHAKPPREELSDDIIRCVDASTSYYEEMYNARLC